jgi:outer membrane protein
MRILLLLSLVVCLPIAACAADLLEVYELALRNDTQLQAAYHARDAVRQNKPLARALLLPHIDGSASYGIERTAITGGDEDSTTTFEPYDYGLDLSQVVFDLADFLRLRQAGDEVAAAEAEYQGEAQALIFRTTAAYFNVLGAEDDLRFARAESESVDQQRKQAEGRFRAGIAAYTDVHEAQAQYDLTRASILAAERRLQSSHQLLTAIVGKAGLELKTLREAIPLPSPQPGDPDLWVERAFESNLDLLAAQIRTEIAERNVDLNWSAYAPSLRLEAGQRFGRTSGFNRGDFDNRGVALNLEVPLFAGLSRQAGVRQSASLRERSRALLEGTRREVERVTRDAFLGVTSGVGQVQALRLAVASNQTALKATEAGLRVGTRTIVDVLTIQRILYGAERDYARARYDYLLSVLRLKQAAGRLQANNLTEINALLVDGDG